MFKQVQLPLRFSEFPVRFEKIHTQRLVNRLTLKCQHVRGESHSRIFHYGTFVWISATSRQLINAAARFVTLNVTYEVATEIAFHP